MHCAFHRLQVLWELHGFFYLCRFSAHKSRAILLVNLPLSFVFIPHYRKERSLASVTSMESWIRCCHSAWLLILNPGGHFGYCNNNKIPFNHHDSEACKTGHLKIQKKVNSYPLYYGVLVHGCFIYVKLFQSIEKLFFYVCGISIQCKVSGRNTTAYF